MPFVRVAFAAAIIAASLACDSTEPPGPLPSPVTADNGAPTAAPPSAPAPAALPASPAAAETSRKPLAPAERQVIMFDACDPDTFNAAVGPGTCVRSGGVTFDKFIAQLTRDGEAAAWRFAPLKTNLREGVTLAAVNKGGEVHTLTEVSSFGGGVVPDLNALSGTPEVAPECTSLGPDDFVAPGGTYREQVDASGTVRFQCCIHPWMRLEARVSD